jgi:hypothetical protein
VIVIGVIAVALVVLVAAALLASRTLIERSARAVAIAAAAPRQTPCTHPPTEDR